MANTGCNHLRVANAVK